MMLCLFTVIKGESECQCIKCVYVIHENSACVSKLTGVVGGWHARVDQALRR